VILLAEGVLHKEGRTVEDVTFTPLLEPSDEIVAALTRWENDPLLIPLARPNQSQEDLERRHEVTLDTLRQRLRSHRVYLIALGARLVGEMSYQIDPEHLLKQVPGTAWVGIVIGEADGRGRGVGRQALHYLEREIAAEGLGRIELGVFAFNLPALALYTRLGYQEFGRVDDFTYWQGRMWQDIRMEKDVPEAG
jgi:RimJ/RimL family protein N-acetyltransferase